MQFTLDWPVRCASKFVSQVLPTGLLELSREPARPEEILVGNQILALAKRDSSFHLGLPRFTSQAAHSKRDPSRQLDPETCQAWLSASYTCTGRLGQPTRSLRPVPDAIALATMENRQAAFDTLAPLKYRRNKCKGVQRILKTLPVFLGQRAQISRSLLLMCLVVV